MTTLSNFIDGRNIPTPQANDITLQKGLTIVFVIIGGLAFIMIVIAGLRFVVSSGEPDKVAQAKNMMLYSLIGLILAALAATIVNFVMERL